MKEQRRRNNPRISLDWFNALAKAREQHEEAVRGGAAFVLQDQYVIHFQQKHSYRLTPGTKQKYRQDQMEQALHFTCKTMGQVSTINGILENDLWKKNVPDFYRPAFSQAVSLISSCLQCQK